MFSGIPFLPPPYLLVCEVCVLCQDVCGEVVVLVLAVEEQQVAKRLRREGILEKGCHTVEPRYEQRA